MDQLHRPEDFPFISDIVDIRKFYEEGRAAKEATLNSGVSGAVVGGASASPACDPNEKLAKRMGCTSETVAELAELCDPEKLKCGLEGVPLSGEIPLEGQMSLVTLEIQQRELQKRKNKLSYRQMVSQMHKYKRMNFQVLDTFRDVNEREGLHRGYVPSDIILTVSLTKPYNRVLEHHEIRLGRLLAMDSSFNVLGNTSLPALRDKISCLCDWSVMQDCSEQPDSNQAVLAKDVYKSGFFYINGVFYNDQRDGSSLDLSQPIFEWAKRRNDEVGPFTTASMQDTKFIDLKLRLGQPYLYLHQGTCEHLLIFSDLRMLSSSDSQNIDDYPLLVSLKPKKRVPCCACKAYTAKWVAYEHEELPFDPGFFCEACYRSFNYDKDGKKAGNFQAMPYYDRSVLS